jgi:hypothetical protein
MVNGLRLPLLTGESSGVVSHGSARHRCQQRTQEQRGARRVGQRHDDGCQWQDDGGKGSLEPDQGRPRLERSVRAFQNRCLQSNVIMLICSAMGRRRLLDVVVKIVNL